MMAGAETQKGRLPTYIRQLFKKLPIFFIAFSTAQPYVSFRRNVSIFFRHGSVIPATTPSSQSDPILD
jgi:hypothetical protein